MHRYLYVYPLQARRLTDAQTEPAKWLHTKIKESETETEVTLTIPLKEDGTEYTIDDLYRDQKEVVVVVMDTLKHFMEDDDLSTFKPLRIIINGQGGSGKSVVINTLVTLIRNMFGFNDAVRVIAPTGVAAYNVHGETFHHL